MQSEQMYLYETKKKLTEKSKELKKQSTDQKQQYEKMAQSLKEHSLYSDSIRTTLVYFVKFYGNFLNLDF